MDKEEQYLLFALSTPMEVLYIGNEPSHTSPAMYTGIPAVDLSDSWGIDNREDLIQTIYRMTDDGHAADLAPFLYPLVYAISSSMARIYRAVWRAGPDLCAICCRNRTMLRARRH